MDRLSEWSPKVLSVLRIVVALLFVQHGLMKLAHFPAPQAGAPSPLPPLLMLAATIEIVAGSLMAVGFVTRWAAFVSSGEMAVAYFMAHFPQSPWPGVSGGDLAIVFCFVFFYLFFAGPGPWSIDAWLRGARGAHASP